MPRDSRISVRAVKYCAHDGKMNGIQDRPRPMRERTAVVLLNLGGPDSLESVQPFLYNLFSDPDIFAFPLGSITQKLFAYIISKRRTPEASQGYAAIGGRSPLRENTEKQATALQRALADEPIDIFIAMRYWHPLIGDVVRDLKEQQYRRVILLPLYPQYSRTTTGSAYNEFVRQCTAQHYRPDLVLIEQWYDEPDYEQAIVESVRAEAARFSRPDPADIAVIFSAHGLPQKIVDQGDPYEQQIRATYASLVRRLGWRNTTLCYQSRVGPLEWLKPYTDTVIREKAAAGVKQMLVYPIAFVSDHIETLYELGMTYARLARDLGVEEYRVAPALNDHPLLVSALRKLALTARARS